MSAQLAEVYMEEGMVGVAPRLARIESDVATLKVNVAQLDEKVERLDEKVERLDEKVDGLGNRMTAIESGFVGMNENQSRLYEGLRDLRNSLDTKFMWIVTTMIAFGTALIAAMAEGFHWIK
jgi:chromosome segregation ATPase